MKSPPFCPNKACSNYRHPPANGHRWFSKRGFYHRKQGEAIQRFTCRSCGHSFSSRTFSIDYRTNKHLSYHRIFTHLITCSGIRDIARDLRVAPTTVINRISRLSRQTQAAHRELVSQIHLAEELAADGFESFAVSQYYPNNIHLLAGKSSQFWYATDYAHLRRKGCMTEGQKERNRVLQQAFFSGRTTIYRSFSRIVEAIEQLLQTVSVPSVTLHTDDHIQYRRVLSAMAPDLRCCIRHVITSSKKARTVTNNLFAVNYLDRELRKDCAEHVRETMKYARNVSNCLERLAIYRFYHNYMKPFRIDEAEYRCIGHGMMAGLDGREVAKQVKTLFTRRRFLFRTEGMSFSEALVWLRGVATPLKRYAEYLPAYAWD